MIVSFELSMPGNNAWNDRWSGEGRTYAILKTYRKLPSSFKLGYYSYDFRDGWRAGVTVREVDAKTARMLKKTSKGFCGYDWMITSIIYNGDIYGPMNSRKGLDATI